MAPLLELTLFALEDISSLLGDNCLTEMEPQNDEIPRGLTPHLHTKFLQKCLKICRSLRFLAVRFELTTSRLQDWCSANWAKQVDFEISANLQTERKTRTAKIAPAFSVNKQTKSITMQHQQIIISWFHTEHATTSRDGQQWQQWWWTDEKHDDVATSHATTWVIVVLSSFKF